MDPIGDIGVYEGFEELKVWEDGSRKAIWFSRNYRNKTFEE